MKYVRPTYRAAEAAPQMNLTPLLDVLLVLLVIMLIMLTQYNKQMPVSLPVSDIQGVPLITQSLQVSIAPNGQLIHKFRPISAKEMAELVDSRVTIELAVDKEVTYDLIAARVAELQRLQPKTIALVTR